MVQAKAVLENRSEAPVLPQFKIITTSSIHVRGDFNFRKEFDEKELVDLADSIRTKGIAQPLLVRDNARWGGKGYDLIAGERRFRAAKLIKLNEVPAMVYDIDDVAADELMVLENLQRKDLHPLEYANGFERMMKQHGYTIEQLAERANKGTTFIRDLLHLVKLPDEAREALQEGGISKSVGVLIATIPDERQREKFSKEVLQGGTYNRGEALTFRAAKQHKEHFYMKLLSGAPFPLDQQLDPLWPHSCKTCPHFAGNSGTSQQGKRSDICLNPTHFDTMAMLFGQSLMERAIAEGRKVLTAAESKKVFDNYEYSTTCSLRYDADYVEASGSIHDYKTNKGVQWGAIAKKAGLEKILAVDPKGKPRTLFKKAAAEKAAKEQGIQKNYSSSSPSSRTQSASDRQRKLSADARKPAALEALTTILNTTWSKTSGAEIWHHIAAALLRGISSYGGDGLELLAVQLSQDSKTAKTYGEPEKFLIQYLAKLTNATHVQRFIAGLCICEELDEAMSEYGSGFEKPTILFFKAFDVDLTKLEQQELKKQASLERIPAAKKAKPAVKRGGKQ